MFSLSVQKPKEIDTKKKTFQVFVIGLYIILNIHFGEDKTKCILFGTNHRLNEVSRLHIRYEEIHIKKYHTVTYPGCSLDEDLSGESIPLKVSNKINSRLRFLIRKNSLI